MIDYEEGYYHLRNHEEIKPALFHGFMTDEGFYFHCCSGVCADVFLKYISQDITITRVYITEQKPLNSLDSFK